MKAGDLVIIKPADGAQYTYLDCYEEVRPGTKVSALFPAGVCGVVLEVETEDPEQLNFDTWAVVLMRETRYWAKICDLEVISESG